MTRVPPPSHQPDPLIALRRLTARDRLLLSWLADHHVLTTGQVAAALFPSRRAAQHRLTVLHRIGAVDRFAYPRDAHTAGDYRYTLGPLGLLLHPPETPAARTAAGHLRWRARLAANPQLPHLLGVNQFFIDLHAHARTAPGARLERWWSEHRATTVWATAGIHPDAHGIWTAAGATVGFFLEHDRGTEDLPRVLAKLRGYARLAADGPRYPVLLHVPDPAREAALHRALHGAAHPVAMATATHDRHPAGPVWALAGHPGPRLALHQLPSDHGPDSPTNPHRYPSTEDLPPVPTGPTDRGRLYGHGTSPRSA